VPLAVPATLQASLMSRLDRIPAAKGMAQVGVAAPGLGRRMRSTSRPRRGNPGHAGPAHPDPLRPRGMESGNAARPYRHAPDVRGIFADRATGVEPSHLRRVQHAQPPPRATR
jgi:hypothetical protein